MIAYLASTRRSQPYRKGAATRAPGASLSAMTRGRAAYARHPLDTQRQLQRRYHAKRRGKGLARMAIRPY